VDEEDVIAYIIEVRENPDCMAVECVGYTHDPIVSHLTGRPDRIAVVDNMLLSAREVRDVGEITQVNECVVESPSSKTGVALHSQCNDVVQVTTGLVADIATATAEEVLDAEEVVNSGLSKPSSVYRVCQDVVEVKHHRRLPHSSKGKYVAASVSEIKNRLGCPKPTEANKLAVRRMAFNNATQHGIRPTHLRVVIEQIVAGVFVPDDHDLMAARALASNTQSVLEDELRNAQPKGAWTRLFNSHFPRLSRSRVSRLRSQE